MAVATAVALSGVIALPVIALTSSGGPGRHHSALMFTGPATTTTVPSPVPTTTGAPATNTPATTLPAPVTTTTTVAAARQQAATTTSTTTLVCRNSYNPACGPFRWDRSPAPAGNWSVSLQYFPKQPAVGDLVTFTVTISDPNTSVYTCGQVMYGDGMGENCAPSSAPCQTRYGPWDPPAKHADSVTTSYTYKYQKAGKYTFSVAYPVGSSCYDPYQAQASASQTLTVSAAAASPSSP